MSGPNRASAGIHRRARQRALAALALLALVALGAGSAPAQEPRARVLESPPRIRVDSLPDLLRDAELADHLDTGLTSTLVLTARARGERAFEGALRIDVRYDLWDEVYLVEIFDGGERSAGTRAAPESRTLDAEQLSAWWRSVTLDLPGSSRRLAEVDQVEVTLSLVPFSEAERRDTELWYSGSARSAEASASRPGGDLGGILELVNATSIRREEQLRYDWRVAVERTPSRVRDPADPP